MGFFKVNIMISLMSFGEVLVDFIPNNEQSMQYQPLAGGAPANVAVAFAKLGGDSYFAGGISCDNFGLMLEKQLNQHGVDTSHCNKVDTANTALVLVSLDSDGERSFNFYRNHTADTLYPKEKIDQIPWHNIDIFHFCSNTLTSKSMNINTHYALAQAKSNNTLISFDVNLRQQLWQDLTLLPNRIDACIQSSDIVKLSKDEALYLADIKDLCLQDYVEELITSGVKLVLITDGANSVRIHSKDYELSSEVPKIKALDTTAAGDSFISGMLFYLAQESSSYKDLFDKLSDQEVVLSAVEFSSKCGAHTCQQKGAFDALPKKSDI
jgi:fructokinase